VEFEPLLEQSPAKPWVKRAGLIGGGLLLAGLLAGMAISFMKNSGPVRKRVIQEITLVKPPPPPPPPKQIEKPPEPEIKEVKIEEQKLDEPKPLENEPPPALKDLGVIGEGVAGGDAFGLEARAGGTDLLQTKDLDVGGGGGGAAAPIPEPQAMKAPPEPSMKLPEPKKNFSWYTVQIQQHIQDALARSERLQGSAYKVVVRVWLDADGGVKRVELVDSSGDQGTDASLRSALQELPKIAEAPPDGLPQPIRLRIISRL
jgi:periplasmic protein TonB